MTYEFDWAFQARQVDRQFSLPDDWDNLSPDEKEQSDFYRFVSSVNEAYIKSQVQKTVEVMQMDPKPFVVSSEEDILDRPSPRWLIQDLIQESTICVLAGPGGLGKSFLALAIARALACEAPFFGKETQQGNTLYVVAEGAAAFGDRVRAWNEAHRSLMVPRNAITYVEQGVNLKDPQSIEKLRELVVERDISLVILDTFSQLSYIENENANAETAEIYRAIKSVRDAREGTTCLVLHHTPAGGGKARGATAHRDNADTMIMAIPVGEKGEDGFSLSTLNSDNGKQKDGKEIEWHGFALQSVLNSAIVVNSGGKRPLSPYWEKCLRVLQDGRKHSSAELRLACGIDADARSAEGKRLGRELDYWVKDELVIKSGTTRSTMYELADKVAAVAS